MTGTGNSTGNDETRLPRARRMPLAYHAVTLAAFFAASSAPTPLYRLYQQAYAFSPVLIALIFAVYAFSLLVSLLIVGSISDHLGRRPVIFASLLLLMVAIALFLSADGLGMLIAARMSIRHAVLSSTAWRRLPAWGSARSAPAPSSSWRRHRCSWSMSSCWSSR
jgi:MFS family permease